MEIDSYKKLKTIPQTGEHVLTKDIDCTGESCEPLYPDPGTPFKGTLDGGGYTIRNFNVMRRDSNYVGLFGFCEGATIKNLAIECSLSGSMCVGGIAGQCRDTTISNCFVKGDIVARNDGAGGIAGHFITGENSRTITGCCHLGSVTVDRHHAGGICGMATSHTAGEITVSRCYHVGECRGQNYVGGIIGYAWANISKLNVRQCYSLGAVVSESNTSGEVIYAGGLVGYNSRTTVADSLALCSGIDACSVDRISQAHPIMPEISKPYEINNCYAWRGMTLYFKRGQKTSGDVPMSFQNVIITDWSELSHSEFYEQKLGWNLRSEWTLQSNTYPFPKIRPSFPMKGKVQPVSFSLDPRFPVGDGKSEKTAYPVYTPEHFDKIRQELNAFYTIEYDLDFTGFKSLYSFDGRLLPIGDADKSFNGCINGLKENKLTAITGLMIDCMYTDDAGLFGCVGTTGKISGLKICGTVKGGSNTGLVAGYNLGNISVCSAEGSAEGLCAGGIAGSNFGSITDCLTAHDGEIIGTVKCGGIAGENCGTVERCYTLCAVRGAGSLGGITGIHYKLSGGCVKYCVAAHRWESLYGGIGIYLGGISGETYNDTNNNYIWDNVLLYCNSANETALKKTIDELTERSFWEKLGYLKEPSSSCVWKWNEDFPYL